MRAALALLLLLSAGCKQCQPVPDSVSGDCQPDVGGMLRMEGLVYSNIYDCYICEKAGRCFTSGTLYCCSAAAMCSECSSSLINTAHHLDAGSK